MPRKAASTGNIDRTRLIISIFALALFIATVVVAVLVKQEITAEEEQIYGIAPEALIQ